jgi:hypothetical protein
MLFSTGNMAAAIAVGKLSSMGSLTGTIVGPDGKPIAGARAWVDNCSNKQLAEKKADPWQRAKIVTVESGHELIANGQHGKSDVY